VPRAAICLAFGSVVSIVFSIAVSQLLLGLALIVLQAPPRRLRFPPIKLQLLLFFCYTVLSALLSGHAAAGWPQIRKFFVWGIALAVASTFQSVRHVRLLCLSWMAMGCVSVGVALAQLVRRVEQARAQGWGGYGWYLDSRLTGLSGHWMTYGGELMIILLFALSFVLFSQPSKWRIAACLSLPFLWVGIVLGLTRGIFLFAVPLAGIYLLRRTKWLAVALPICAIVLLLAAPLPIRERLTSIFHPHSSVDSNSRRMIMARAGWAMIAAHPWFGVGPEQVGPQFLRYVPKDVPRPLPKGWYGHLHNIYLQFAAERGIPALMLILWLIATVIADLHRTAAKFALNANAWPLHGCVAVCIAVLAEGMFEHNLGDSEVLTMFLATVACGYVSKWQLESDGTTDITEREPALAGALDAQHNSIAAMPMPA